MSKVWVQLWYCRSITKRLKKKGGGPCECDSSFLAAFRPQTGLITCPAKQGQTRLTRGLARLRQSRFCLAIAPCAEADRSEQQAQTELIACPAKQGQTRLRYREIRISLSRNARGLARLRQSRFCLALAPRAEAGRAALPAQHPQVSMGRDEFLRGVARWGFATGLGALGVVLLRRGTGACLATPLCAACPERKGCSVRSGGEVRKP